MSLRAHRLATCGAALVVCGSARVYASEVRLEVSDCPGLSESALREHIELELATLELGRAAATLAVHCQGSGVAIQLERPPGSHYPIQVQVDLRDTARGARERLVALAATELLAQAERGRPSEATAPLLLTQASPAAPRDRDGRQPPRDVRRASELFVAGSVGLHGVPRTVLWGGSLGALLGLGRSWSLLLDTRFERGQKSLPLASVRWSVLSGFVGPALRAQAGPFELAGGLGLRAGWLAFDAAAASPNEGASLTAPWAGLALPVRLGVGLAGGVTPLLGGEAGYVIVPVRGLVDGQDLLVAERSVWISGYLGVGVSL